MSNYTLEAMAGELYVRHCDDGRERRRNRHARHDQPAQARQNMETQTHAISSILPELIGLVAERRHQPVAHLRPTIRRAISEHLSAGIGDSGAEPTHCDRMVDREVEVVLTVLEQVRRRAIRDGQWSDAPVTPLMFG